jgi:hypothetical protein
MNNPINPAHYNGTACAEIGERLTANSYQVLKYNWRLGKKDDPIIEVGKSIWYLDREIKYAQEGHGSLPYRNLPSADFFESRLIGAPAFLYAIAHALINWNRYGDVETLLHLRNDLIAERARLEFEINNQTAMEI